MELRWRIKVHPDMLSPDVNVGLGLEPFDAPMAESLAVEDALVSGNHHAAWELQQDIQQPIVIPFGIVVGIDSMPPARARQIWRIRIDQLAAGKAVGLQEFDCVSLNELTKAWKAVFPSGHDRLIDINADVGSCWPLVPQYRTTAEMRLNVGLVRRHEIDQALIGLSFSARIPHERNIVILDAVVKRLCCLCR